MSFHTFRLLSPELQLYYVLTRSIFLVWRWEGEAQIMLHYLPNNGRGFFVEVGVDEEQTHFLLLRSFSSPMPLAAYAHNVRLPEWVPRG